MTVATVTGLDDVGGSNHLLRLKATEGNLAALGRFFRLRSWPQPFQGLGTLLDRPFSVHRISGQTLDFLIRAVGPATNLLTSLAEGDRVRLIGPLGRGLDELDPSFRSKKWYLAAGGVGLGPMASLAEAIGPGVRLFYGERSAGTQVGKGYLASLVTDHVPVTEDGSGYGHRGLVTEPLIQALKAEKRPIIACGPTAMLAALAEVAKGFGVSYLACTEARMACGLGVCLSCTLPRLDGTNFRVCQEGPLVDGLTLDWGRILA
jgi:NAD(P)H-flavin reductase